MPGQPLAALQNHLGAWGGIWASLASLWKSRNLGILVLSRIWIVTLFFGSASVLQIVVPTTLTTITANKTVIVSEDATRLYIDDPSVNGPLPLDLYTAGNETTALDIMPLIWSEGGDSVGVPQGFNDTWVLHYVLNSRDAKLVVHSVLFGYLLSPISDASFIDSHAHQLQTRCEGSNSETVTFLPTITSECKPSKLFNSHLETNAKSF